MSFVCSASCFLPAAVFCLERVARRSLLHPRLLCCCDFAAAALCASNRCTRLMTHPNARSMPPDWRGLDRFAWWCGPSSPANHHRASMPRSIATVVADDERRGCRHHPTSHPTQPAPHKSHSSPHQGHNRMLYECVAGIRKEGVAAPGFALGLASRQRSTMP